jgi:hypothetical protein
MFNKKRLELNYSFTLTQKSNKQMTIQIIRRSMIYFDYKDYRNNWINELLDVNTVRYIIILSI